MKQSKSDPTCSYCHRPGQGTLMRHLLPRYTTHFWSSRVTWGPSVVAGDPSPGNQGQRTNVLSHMQGKGYEFDNSSAPEVQTQHPKCFTKPHACHGSQRDTAVGTLGDKDTITQELLTNPTHDSSHTKCPSQLHLSRLAHSLAPAWPPWPLPTAASSVS